MVGTVGAIVGARHATQARGSNWGGATSWGQQTSSRTAISEADIARMRKEVEARKEQKRCQKLFMMYDTNKSGKLDRQQISKLLADLGGSASRGTITSPSDEEVDYIIKSVTTADTVGVKEIESVIGAWQAYASKRNEVEEILAKYDVGQTGQLDKKELKNYLTALNDGIPVTDADVEWVMKVSDLSMTGELNKPEVLRATAEWYARVEKSKSHCCCCIVS
jgi:Ca2+-binding EF-hand superfamily protein